MSHSSTSNRRIVARIYRAGELGVWVAVFRNSRHALELLKGQQSIPQGAKEVALTSHVSHNQNPGNWGGSKGQSQPQIGAAALLLLYTVLVQVLIWTHVAPTYSTGLPLFPRSVVSTSMWAYREPKNQRANCPFPHPRGKRCGRGSGEVKRSFPPRMAGDAATRKLRNQKVELRILWRGERLRKKAHGNCLGSWTSLFVAILALEIQGSHIFWVEGAPRDKFSSFHAI